MKSKTHLYKTFNEYITHLIKPYYDYDDVYYSPKEYYTECFQRCLQIYKYNKNTEIIKNILLSELIKEYDYFFVKNDYNLVLKAMKDIVNKRIDSVLTKIESILREEDEKQFEKEIEIDLLEKFYNDEIEWREVEVIKNKLCSDVREYFELGNKPLYTKLSHSIVYKYSKCSMHFEACLYYEILDDDNVFTTLKSAPRIKIDKCD